MTIQLELGREHLKPKIKYNWHTYYMINQLRPNVLIREQFATTATIKLICELIIQII